jgi:hypothetical protein
MNSLSKPTTASVSVKSSFLDGCRCNGARSSGIKDRCQTLVTSDPIEKPDLAIYSQVEELQLGNSPSWDSPDIITNNWRPFRLAPEAIVTVRNLSATVPAINAQVHYSISPFGIGTIKELKLTKIINLSPSSEITLNFPLDAATLDGDPRVGVHIQIDHPHDSSLINNVGAQVHDGGYTTESGREFTIQVPIYNNSNFARQIQLSVLPTDIIASIAPADAAFEMFAPHQQKIATLSMKIPDFIHGTAASSVQKSVTMVGRLSTGELIGGITRLIRIDN